MVRTYFADFQEFGPITFQMCKGVPLPQGGFARATEYATLNEQQATLILTYMRNSEIVRGFKKRLVKAFWALAHPQQNLVTACPNCINIVPVVQVCPDYTQLTTAIGTLTAALEKVSA